MKNLTRAPKLVAYGIAAVAGLLVSGALAGCSGASSSAVPMTPAMQQSVAQNPTALAVNRSANDVWRDSVERMALPTAGCFIASYPRMEWQSVACTEAPHLLYPATAEIKNGWDVTSFGNNAVRVDSVGNGHDYSVKTSSATSEVVASFPAVTGVTTVKSTPNPEYGNNCECGADSYTLQMNSSLFSSAACGSSANCAGWEQFVYENPVGSSKGSLFIQDWLEPTGSGSVKCPSGKGWQSADGGCVQNSASISVPNQNIKNLGELTETGEAASTGDSIYLAVGSTVYGMKNVQSNGITDLAGNWTDTEFNIVGNAGGSIAKFNAGSSVTVSVQADTGNTTAPTCPGGTGTTAESNNLSFVKAPTPTELTFPSILFKESNVSGGGTASCDAIAGI